MVFLFFLLGASLFYPGYTVLLTAPLISAPQVRGAQIPPVSSSSHDQRDHRVPQRGLVHATAHGLQRAAHLPGHPTAGNHTG